MMHTHCAHSGIDVMPKERQSSRKHLYVWTCTPTNEKPIWAPVNECGHWRKLGFADTVQLQIAIIFIQCKDVTSKGIEDMGDTIAMLFIQSGIRANPDEVGEALNDNFVCKNSPQHSKPWATAGEKESGAARAIPDDAVLWVKSFVSHG